MKKLVLALGLAGCCTAAFAQPQSVPAPTPAEATQALQNAMQREIQTMNDRQGFDGPAATGVARSLHVQSLDNCMPSGGQSVTCEVKTSADVRGSRREGVNRYEFYQQAGRWEARLPQS